MFHLVVDLEVAVPPTLHQQTLVHQELQDKEMQEVMEYKILNLKEVLD
jgi:hypothetical protein